MQFGDSYYRIVSNAGAENSVEICGKLLLDDV
jgi:hypothetical protein